MCADTPEDFTRHVRVEVCHMLMWYIDAVYWCGMLMHVVSSWLLQVKVCSYVWHVHVCWHMTVVTYGHVVRCCMLIYCTLSHWCTCWLVTSQGIDAYCITACQHVMFCLSPCVSPYCHMSMCCMTSCVNGCCLSSCLIACHHMLLSWITAAVWTQQLRPG